MTMFRFILFFLLFYVIAKATKFLIKAFSNPPKQEMNPTMNKTAERKLDINREDIIEAEFEEIKEIKESKADKS